MSDAAKKAAMVEALRGGQRRPSPAPPGLDARVDARVVPRPQTQTPTRKRTLVIGVRG